MNDLYILKFKPTRQDFLTTMTEAESQVIGQHFSHVSTLKEKGLLLLAGRRSDAGFGIVIFRASSSALAEKFMTDDPAIKERLFEGSVGSFEIAIGDQSLDSFLNAPGQ